MIKVADASTIVTALLSEHGGTARARLAAEPELHVPHLADLEVLSALRTMHRNGSLSERGVRQARHKLGLLPMRRYPHAPFGSRIWTGRSSPSSSRARRLDQPACSPGRPWWSVLLTSRKILSQHDPAALGWPRRCASVSPGRGSRDVGVHHPGHAAARRRGGGGWRGDPRGPVALRPAARRHGAGGRGGRGPRGGGRRRGGDGGGPALPRARGDP